MDIRSAAESFDHMLVVAEMRHDAQFDLRIVGREESTVRIVGNEGFTDFTSQCIPDRDILQVRVGRTQTAGGGDCLVVRCVDLTCYRADQFGQRIDIGAQ